MTRYETLPFLSAFEPTPLHDSVFEFSKLARAFGLCRPSVRPLPLPPAMSTDRLSSPFAHKLMLESPLMPKSLSLPPYNSASNRQIPFPPQPGRKARALCPLLHTSSTSSSVSLDEHSEDDEDDEVVLHLTPSLSVPTPSSLRNLSFERLATPPAPFSRENSPPYTFKSTQLPPRHPPAPLSSVKSFPRVRSLTEDAIAADTGRFPAFFPLDDTDRMESSCSFASSPSSQPQVSPRGLGMPRNSPSPSFKRSRDGFDGEEEGEQGPSTPAAPSSLRINTDICNGEDGGPVLTSAPTNGSGLLGSPPDPDDAASKPLLLPSCGFQSEQICITGETVSANPVIRFYPVHPPL